MKQVLEDCHPKVLNALSLFEPALLPIVVLERLEASSGGSEIRRSRDEEMESIET